MKNTLLLSFILFFVACSSNNERSEPVTELPPPPPTVAVEEEVKTNEETKVELLVPDSDEKKHYRSLKNELMLEKEKLVAFLSSNKKDQFKPLNTISSGELNEMANGVIGNSIVEFISKRNLDKATFSKAINHTALALGYALIDDFGDSRDKSGYDKLETKINGLVNAGVITDSKLIKYKVYEKFLNCSRTPAPGNENVKVLVDENGTVTYGGQKMGMAVEEDGIFYLKIDQ